MFRSRTPNEAVDLIAKVLIYEPNRRYKPLDALVHPFFNELRKEGTTLPNGNPLPDLFNFSKEELDKVDADKAAMLIPEWYRAKHEGQSDQPQ